MIKNYIITAFRSILRNKSISIINIVGLSISLSVCLLLVFIVADQYSYDNFHSKKDQIYRVYTDRVQNGQNLWQTATTTFTLKDELVNQSGVAEVTAVQRRLDGVAKWNSKEIPFYGYYTDNTFLSVFDFPLKYGSRETALETPNSVILSADYAEKIFGDQSPDGEIVEIEKIGSFIVTGVLDQPLGKSHLNFDLIVSSENLLQRARQDSTLNSVLTNKDNVYDTYIYVNIPDDKNKASVEVALAEYATVTSAENEQFDYSYQLQPLTGITPGPLYSNMSSFSLPMFVVYGMLGIALIVLTSACFNYANLTTARGINRAKEIGVRKVVGAYRKHIFAQFMIEAVIMALIAFFFADIILQFTVPAMNNYFLSLGAPMTFNETPALIWIFVLIALFAGVMSGLVPALFFSSTKPIQALKKVVNFSGKKSSWFSVNIRKLLLVVQFAFSLFFITTMVTIYQQLNYVMNKDHGFRKEQLINVHLNGVNYEDLKPSLAQSTIFETYTATSHLPALGSNYTMEVTTDRVAEPFNMSYFSVDHGYIKTMDLNLLVGRDFSDNTALAEKEIIINETAVKKLGLESPIDAIGEVIHQDDELLQVVGVLKDFHYERLDQKIGSLALRLIPGFTNHLIVHVDPEKKDRAEEELKQIWQKHTNRDFESTLVEDDLKMSYGHFEALLMVTSYVSIIVVSLACLGLLGMVIFHVQNKTKEIGIRKTLGAKGLNIFLITSKGFAVMMLIAFFIGAPLSYLFNMSWLETNVYRTDFGAGTIVTSLLLMLLIVMITIGSQLYKAVSVNPVETLKQE